MNTFSSFTNTGWRRTSNTRAMTAAV